MNNDKINNIINYYLGVKSYNLFLQGLIFNNPIYSNYIKNDDYIKISKVAFISNIFLSIKESLVDKTSPKIDSNVLENTVTYIAKKTKVGYQVDNYTFSTKEELYITIRNKLGHGNYSIDLQNNKVLIYHDNTIIKLNIDKLTKFVISSFKNYLNFNTNINRKIIYNEKLNSTRTKIISSTSELKGLLKHFKICTINFKRKDNKPLTEKEYQQLECILNTYRQTNDIKVLHNYSCIVKDNYILDYTLTSLKDKDISKLVIYLQNTTNESNYQNQTNVIANEVSRYVKEDVHCNNNEIPLTSNLCNLILLESIKKTNSVDKDKIFSYIQEKYSNINMIGLQELVSSGISMFNVLFSYGLDSIYTNKTDKTASLDYSKLDLSKINVTYTNITENIENKINRLDDDAKNIQKNIDKINTSINTKYSNLTKIKNNPQAVTILQNNINKLLSDKQTLLNEYKEKLNELKDYKIYVTRNAKSLYNERIVNGIRNSIAHGNYKINIKTSFKDSTITFDDIYGEEDNKLTFSCTVNVLEFINLIDANSLIINDYLNSIKQSSNIPSTQKLIKTI